MAQQLDAKIVLQIDWREVWVRPWLYIVDGPAGYEVPVILLDTDVEENAPEEREACQRLMPAHEVACTREALNEGTAGAFSDAEVVTTFIDSRLDAGVLRLLPRLRLVATRSTGVDHIDLDYCRAHGISVCNVPGYGDHTVAEHAFSLLLAIARNIVDSVERTRRGNFGQSGLRGFAFSRGAPRNVVAG